ncbi:MULTISPECIES: TlpA family protein disulfide reductase [Butyricimonas]|uniref:TlpA family protein disulfide reductase n=1 Tax=Butyricimonas TaxID=574697 RepID=UPI0007FB4D37|nr:MULTISPECIES: TlpA disulfide reductase family protein [Butyricimonas]
MKSVFSILSLFFALVSSAQTLQSTEKQKDSFTSAREILTAYPNCSPKHSAANLRNKCHFILQGGAYIISHRGKPQDISLLLKHLPRINIEDSIVTAFMSQHGTAKFTDYYYMLQALKKGETFDAARDGISMSTEFPTRSLNHNDYTKLKDIFSHNNTLLHDTYLEKMKFLFRNNGYPKEIAKLQPIIESHVADSPLKQEILKLYAQYAPLAEGKPAPLSPLQDVDGKNYTFADFKGKVIVVDIWATWCCNCIEKMPKFMQLKEEFRGNSKIIFLTVSIDRKDARDKWLKAIKKNNMTDMLNLISTPTKESNFETEYHVVGIPRYCIIDKKGQIVTTFAPGPGKEMKELILNALKQ